MTANHANFYIDKGADFTALVQLVGINRCPLDLTDMRFASQARFPINERFRVPLRCRVECPRDGILRLHIPYGETERMPPGDWLYDVEMTYPGNRRMRILQGRLTVTDESTLGW